MYKSTTGSLLSTCFSFDKYLSIAGIGTITATASPNPYCLTAPAQTITLTGTTGNLTTSCGLTHEWYTAASITGAPAYTSNPQTGLTPVSGQVYYYAVTNTTSDVCYGTAQTLPLVQNVPVADEPNFPAATFSTNLTTTWTGASTNGSDDWFIHDNWSHCVPNATTNALINYNAANQPEVTTQTGNANAMKIMTGSPGAKVTITPPAAKIVLTY